ncbi:MAG: NAD(P)/FAD-dependent oxidoreductase [Bdellovibrionia bacterium]
MNIASSANLRCEKTVVIVGAGFAGLNAAQKISKNPKVHLILIDQKNHHLFQPLLYQVATAGLSPGDIASPIRAQFSNRPNTEIRLGKVDIVDLAGNSISVAGLKIKYDYLILACGALHSYFKHPEWEEYAPGLKTIEQATEMRRRILLAFELAENEIDPTKLNSLLTFVIVGGGPTGVELAGAIADISRTVLKQDFRKIDPTKAKVILLEAGPRILTSFSNNLSEKAKRDLENLGVEVRVSTRVEQINRDGVYLANSFIPTHNAFWAAGVQAAKLDIQPPAKTDASGRIKVEPDFSIPGFPNAYVVGDMAAYLTPEGKGLPGVAPAAIQAGKFVGAAIVNAVLNKSKPIFKYADKGQMATIGKNKAIAQIGRIELTGRPAWLAWLFVHVFFLIGVKNKISVIILWAWSYLFSKRGARLITDKDWKIEH